MTVGTAVVRVYAGGIKEVHVDLRPLAFGTAWKVLDLLVELALFQAGFGTGGWMTIAEKVRHARGQPGIAPRSATTTRCGVRSCPCTPVQNRFGTR